MRAVPLTCFAVQLHERLAVTRSRSAQTSVWEEDVNALLSAVWFSSELIRWRSTSRPSASCFQLLVFSLLVTFRGVQKAVSFNIQEAVRTAVRFLVCDDCSVSPYLPVKMTLFIRNTGSLFCQCLNFWWRAFHSDSPLLKL